MSNNEPHTPPRLDALPSELLLEIFSHLAPKPSTILPATSENTHEHDNYRLNISLRNVKAVCKGFAALVTPLITAHYCDGDFYHVRINAKKPGNWDQVKSIIIDGPLYDWSFYHHGKETFHEYLKLRDVDEQLALSEAWKEEEEEALFLADDREDVEYVSMLDQKRWKAKLKDEWGVDDTAQSNYERAAVLCLCPNVEEILFGSDLEESWREYSEDEDFIAIDPIVHAAKGEMFGNAHRFEHLRFLSIDVQFIRIWNVVPVMRLPSLQHLVLEWRNWATAGFNGRETEKAMGDWGCPDRLSNVQTLELRNIQAPSCIIGRLIKSCKMMRVFSVDCAVSISEDQQKWYTRVFDHLKEHASTLEELVVTSSVTIKSDYEGHGALGPTELVQFEKLRHLQIPFHVMTGYSSERNDAKEPALPDFCTLFPPSLQSVELDIFGATPEDETREAFSNLLQQETKLPHLERVHVTWTTLDDTEYNIPTNESHLLEDLPSLSTLARSNSKISFDYTLLHEGLDSASTIELARAKILRLKQGEELLKHATCRKEKKWKELLSRPVDTPLPFGRIKNVYHEDARNRGWLREELSAEELAEKVKEYEPKSIYTSIKYNF